MLLSGLLKLTGPGPGKIKIADSASLCGKARCIEVACEVYLHVKGWSLARVTHIDVECPEMNSILKPGEGVYVRAAFRNCTLRIFLRRRIYLPSLGIVVNEIRVRSDLFSTLENRSSWAYLGGKVGGVFVGFRKEIITELEKVAKSMGVEPR